MASILRKNLARDYALTLSWRYAEVELLGLPNLKDERVFRLEHIYVPLRLCNDLADKFDKQKTFYVPKALQEHRHLVVLGDPGSGKSTLIKVLTYAFGEADDNAYKRACGELIPIPIILRDYKTREWQSYKDILRDFIATLDEDIRSEITPEWLLDHLREGKAILLIDGLDEVGSSEDRLHLRDDIIFPLLEKMPQSYAVLTSRVIGYEEVKFDFLYLPYYGGSERIAKAFAPLLKRYYVTPFGDEEIAQFIARWYQLRETFPDKQREGVESLTSALNQNDRVKRLAHNPQLLTLMALIHRVTANLPSGRVELYDKIVEAYLETIQVYRKLGTPAKLDEMKRWLAKVGWEMQVRLDKIAEEAKPGVVRIHDLFVSREEIRVWLIEAIARERGEAESPEMADHFLKYVVERSGLLVEHEPGKFSFAHLTFQEYFAAFELRCRVRHFDDLAQTCVELVAKRHWHETLNVLFEMLTEFHGAGDDLFKIMARLFVVKARLLGVSVQQDDDQTSMAEFFSVLLLDEQNGLSSTKQQQAAQLALDSTCNIINDSITENLRQLAPPQFAQWIAQPLEQQLQTAQPSVLGHDFFLVGDKLLEEWPQLVRQAIKERGHLDWSIEQVEEMALIGSGAMEVVTWAGNRLPLPYWLTPVSSLKFSQQISLVELNSTLTLNASALSARHLLLAQGGLTLIAGNSQIVKIGFLTRTLGQDMYWSQALEHVRVQSQGRKRYLNMAQLLDLLQALDRALTRVLDNALDRDRIVARALGRAFIVSRDPALTRNLAMALSTAITSPRLEQTEEYSDALVIIGADAEWLAFQPAREEERAATIARLREYLSADDNWTQLQAINYLITLSAGTPELCEERNQLLDRALQEPAKFTFPNILHEVTQSQDFITKEFPEAIRIIFLHEPGDPLLKPEWFDPNREESRFFLSSPREFFALAAEMLDPKGETELAKWRTP